MLSPLAAGRGAAPCRCQVRHGALPHRRRRPLPAAARLQDRRLRKGPDGAHARTRAARARTSAGAGWVYKSVRTCVRVPMGRLRSCAFVRVLLQKVGTLFRFWRAGGL
eukprot:5254492-Pleurochrysis_carterae.AAC.1